MKSPWHFQTDFISLCKVKRSSSFELLIEYAILILKTGLNLQTIISVFKALCCQLYVVVSISKF